ncbi:MAG: SNF2-related protein [Thauera sp.]|nr:SNF2-related protein [Thauera sp.]
MTTQQLLTPHQSQYYAWLLTRRAAGDSVESLASTLVDSQVDLNPHQVEAALFACRNPLSRGVILADEVGLGKTIEAGLVISQRWAERRRKVLIIVPANLRKQWHQELQDKFGLQGLILEAKSYNAIRKQERQNPFLFASGPVICSYQFAKAKADDVKGIDWDTTQEYEELKKCNYPVQVEGVSKGMPSLEEDIYVCDSVMRMAPETNGEVAHKSWSALSKKTGIDHHHLYAGRHEDKITFRDIVAQPRKIITAPTWSGIESETVSYTAGYTNIHEHIPFRTLTGRAHFYQDHEWFLDFGEGFCAYKPPVDLKAHENVPASVRSKPHLTLSWITPHSKWGIHSSYQDNLRMLNLFRGGPYVWLSEEEAASIGIRDNDWVEAINANGATVARAVVSQRIPRGMAIMYHAQEKNVNVPGSNSTGKRGGILNSVTRVIVKPTNMVGGYAQLAYSFNYYGTVGCQRDEVVVIHKIEDQDIDWLERPLTPEREAQRNPVGIGKK